MVPYKGMGVIQSCIHYYWGKDFFGIVVYTDDTAFYNGFRDDLYVQVYTGQVITTAHGGDVGYSDPDGLVYRRGIIGVGSRVGYGIDFVDGVVFALVVAYVVVGRALAA